MDIEIWTVGKANASYIQEGIDEYFKKTKPYINIKLEILQLPRKMATQDRDRAISLEGEMILNRLQSHHYLILLDERGKPYDSKQWANKFQQIMNEGTKTMVLLIGGAYGVSPKVKESARQMWSLSPLVFPHQLVRLIVAEQIYRAYSILNNSPYHHT